MKHWQALYIACRVVSTYPRTWPIRNKRVQNEERMICIKFNVFLGVLSFLHNGWGWRNESQRRDDDGQYSGGGWRIGSEIVDYRRNPRHQKRSGRKGGHTRSFGPLVKKMHRYYLVGVYWGDLTWLGSRILIFADKHEHDTVKLNRLVDSYRAVRKDYREHGDEKTCPNLFMKEGFF